MNQQESASRSEPSARSSTAPDTIKSELASDPDMAELIELFVHEMPERAQLVINLFEAGNLDELKRAAHQLKGASGGYGFPIIGAKAGSLESTLNALFGGNQPTPANPTLDQLQSIHREVDELVALCRKASV